MNKFYRIDKDYRYENLSFFGQIFNNFWIGIATLLPLRLSALLLVQSKKAEIVRAYPTQYKALEEMYTFNKEKFKLHWSNIFDRIWLNQKNPKALRNRLILFKKVLDIESKKCSNTKIKILSLGSGSARGVVEFISEYQSRSITALLIDRDPNAITYSRTLAKENNICDRVEQIQMDIENAFDIIREYSPDIVEMVGILDYFKDERVVRVVNKLYDSLKKEAIVVTANINTNHEEKFIARTLNWEMIHRSPEEFYRVLNNTKYSGNIEVIYEPLMVHGIALLRR